MTSKRIRIDGKTAYVPLTQGLEAIIDANDVELVEPYNWHAARIGKRVYARTATAKQGGQVIIDMRQVLFGDTGGQRVYHIGEDLDYRRANMRVGPRPALAPAPVKSADTLPKRDIRVDGAVAYVPLSQGLEAMVDAEDASIVAPYTWSAQKAGGKFRAVTTIDGDMVYLHRMLLKAPPGRQVRGPDNLLDCRKASLGIAGPLSGFSYPRRQGKVKGKRGREPKRPGGKPARLQSVW